MSIFTVSVCVSSRSVSAKTSLFLFNVSLISEECFSGQLILFSQSLEMVSMIRKYHNHKL